MRNIEILFMIALGIWSNRIQAQDFLTLERAVKIALEHNHDIRIERHNAKITENNMNKGNAGLLPTIDVSGSYNYNYYIKQTTETGNFLSFGTGSDSTGSDNQGLGGEGLGATSYAASLTASYILFNGFQGKYRYQQLQTNNAMAKKQLDIVVERTFEQTLNAYLNVARYQAQLKISEESIGISEERLTRNKNANEYGNANALQVLQSEVDLKNDSVEYRNTKLLYDQSKKQLIFLLDLPLESDFTVEEDIVLSDDLEYEPLRESMLKENASLLASRYGVLSSEQGASIEDAGRFPTLSLTGGFNYNRQEAEQSITELTESYGPVIGLSLNYALFDGNRRKTKRQNASIEVSKQQASLKKTTQELEIELLNAYQNHENYKVQLEMERSNLPTYERNFQKTQEDYNLGISTATDLRAAQLNLMNAKYRLIDLEYNVKMVETTLLRLSGKLIVTN